MALSTRLARGTWRWPMFGGEMLFFFGVLTYFFGVKWHSQKSKQSRFIALSGRYDVRFLGYGVFLQFLSRLTVIPLLFQLEIMDSCPKMIYIYRSCCKAFSCFWFLYRVRNFFACFRQIHGGFAQRFARNYHAIWKNLDDWLGWLGLQPKEKLIGHFEKFREVIFISLISHFL